jgi:hypothetical protein
MERDFIEVATTYSSETQEKFHNHNLYAVLRLTNKEERIYETSI